MAASLIQSIAKTPDGVVIPGPHNTSAAGEFYPVLSSTIAFVISGGEVLMVDSGFRTVPRYPSGPLDHVCDVLDRRNLQLKYIVQTHWHLDHVGNTRYLRDRYGAEVVCHPVERPAIEDPFVATRPEYLESFGGDLEAIAADLGLGGPEELLTDEDLVRDHWDFGVTVDREVEDGDKLALGDLVLDVIETPGHSPGHISLYNPSSRSLYLGDVWYWPSPCHPHPAGDAGAHIASIERCLSLGAEYLFPGHNLPRSGAEDARDYLVALLVRARQFEDRILVILARQGPLSLPDLYAELMPIKELFNFHADGWHATGMNALHSFVWHSVQRGDVERLVDAQGRVTWAVTAAGRPADDWLEAAGAYERRYRSLLRQATDAGEAVAAAGAELRA